MITNEEYIQEYISTRGLNQNNTYKSVKLVMNHYSNFQERSIHDLILEADTEEENGIRWKRRTLKTRLINYQNYLRENMTLNSAKTYMKIVKSFYNHHEIEIHKLPKLNEKNSIVQEPVRYTDLPDKEIIKKAYEIAEPLMKTLLLFLSSTGMSKVDALNLTIQDFLDATFEYHQKTDLYTAILKLQKLGAEVDIVPIFRNRRQKTKKYYVTFCTPEAVMEICHYIHIRLHKQHIKPSDKLFKIEDHYYTLKFEELNNALNLGKVGKYNRLRGHMLRKFHASNLEKSGMDRYKINVLQGKSNNAVDDVYFFEDEENLRKEYINHMHSLLILSEVKEVTVHSKEYLEIREENKKLKEYLSEMKSMKREVEEIKKWMM